MEITNKKHIDFFNRLVDLIKKDSPETIEIWKNRLKNKVINDTRIFNSQITELKIIYGSEKFNIMCNRLLEITRGERQNGYKR